MMEVTMYSTAVCPYCVRAEQLLRARGVEDIGKIRIDLEPARRAEMMQKTGRRTVPQITSATSTSAVTTISSRSIAPASSRPCWFRRRRRRGTLTQRDGSPVSRSCALLDRAAGLEQGGDAAAARPVRPGPDHRARRS
jgi:glutaredoxin